MEKQKSRLPIFTATLVQSSYLEQKLSQGLFSSLICMILSTPNLVLGKIRTSLLWAVVIPLNDVSFSAP